MAKHPRDRAVGARPLSDPGVLPRGQWRLAEAGVLPDPCPLPCWQLQVWAEDLLCELPERTERACEAGAAGDPSPSAQVRLGQGCVCPLDGICGHVYRVWGSKRCRTRGEESLENLRINRKQV